MNIYDILEIPFALFVVVAFGFCLVLAKLIINQFATLTYHNEFLKVQSLKRRTRKSST